MKQLSLFDLPAAEPTPAAAALPQMQGSYLEYLQSYQRKQERRKFQMLQIHLLRTLQENGWMITLEPFHPPTIYAAMQWDLRIFTNHFTTPNEAAFHAEYAALFYSTGHLPSSYRLPAGAPLYPNAWRYISGDKITAGQEWYKLYQQAKQEQEQKDRCHPMN